MLVTHFLHMALTVTDLERADQFYSSILGLPKVKRDLAFAGSWYQLGPIQLHLIVAPTVTPDRVNEAKWGRNPHVALGVSDLDLIKTTLKAAGYPIQMSASGRAALFTQDPDGNVIELSQLSS